ncbi:MAG TPA: TolC family protein [Sediminispirochaeta sp.]|nr:TolC family protein [Sediminispirochaeta sp.]
MSLLKKAPPFWLALFVFVSAASSLSLEEALARIEENHRLQKVLIEQEAAENRLSLVSFPGDPRLSFSPNLTSKSRVEGEFSEQTIIGGSLSLDLPIGLSEEQQISRSSAEATFERALMNSEQTRWTTYLEVFSLYQQAWLAELELAVLQLELDAAEERLRITQELFSTGDASLTQMNDAEEDLSLSESALIDGRLKKRLAWLELAYSIGLSPVEEEPLSPVDLVLPEVPRPPELVDMALRKSPDFRLFFDRIAELEAEIAAVTGVFAAPSLRISFSGWDQSATLTYSFEKPGFGLSYNFPIVSMGTDFAELNRGSNSIDTWDLGISVSLPLQSGVSGRLEKEILASEIAILEKEMQLYIDGLNLEIRSRYQQYALSSEAVEQSTRSIELARKTLDTVQQRREEQRATRADEIAARAQLERAVFRYQSALAQQRVAKLQAAHSAYSLDTLLTTK